MSESQIAVLRYMSDGVERQSWQIISSELGDDHPECKNGICRPAVALDAVGMLEKKNGLYRITELGRLALAWHTEGK